jgi:predicted component of type VI protein secretion system
MPRLRFVSTVQGANTIELTEPIITIGRVANNVVCIEDPNISKHHTLLVSEDDTYKIYDLHSVNGTWVNGERITAAKLKDGDAVRIGYLELKYEIGAPVLAPAVGAKPTLTAPPSPKTATGPTTLAARPKLGFKAAGAAPAPAPAVVPPAAKPPSTPIPVPEEKRQPIQVPVAEKKTTGATPAPTAPKLAPKLGLGGPPKLKPLAQPTPPAPAPAPAPPAEPLAPAPAEPPAPMPAEPAAAEPAPPPPAEAPKLGGPPKLKPQLRPTAPAADGEAPAGPKKLGGAPAGGPPKFKLKRE